MIYSPSNFPALSVFLLGLGISPRLYFEIFPVVMVRKIERALMMKRYTNTQTWTIKLYLRLWAHVLECGNRRTLITIVATSLVICIARPPPQNWSQIRLPSVGIAWSRNRQHRDDNIYSPLLCRLFCWQPNLNRWTCGRDRLLNPGLSGHGRDRCWTIQQSENGLSIAPLGLISFLFGLWYFCLHICISDLLSLFYSPFFFTYNLLRIRQGPGAYGH
jgi:hypothetical protein